MDCNCEGYIGRVYRVISEAYLSTARSRIKSSLLLFRYQSKYGCQISSKITNMCYVSIVYSFTQRFNDNLKFCSTTELSL